MLYKTWALVLVTLLVFPSMLSYDVKGYSDHPNLFVSAENSVFQNHFSGAMVVEVIIEGDNTQLNQAQGEPNVNVNGKQLRMVQGSDGYWYAFFANTNAAKQADQIALGGAPGQNLDFGVFCSGSTSSSVLGADFSQTDGVAIPDSSGLSGTTQGLASFNSCSGTLQPPAVNQNNVVRNPPSLNTNPSVSAGQIGINQNIWPVIQLFSLNNDVNVEYDAATGTQSVDLTYFEIPNISITLDRNAYSTGSEVFATINDIQLDEDPTAIDSWTFNVNNPEATFYQAFSESGGSNTSGLVNLVPYLSSLGFQDNGKVEMNLGSVVNLKTNNLQTSSSIIANGVTYNQLVTFVETGPNTGVFESDYDSISTIGISQNAPRGQSSSIEYDQQSTSIVSGTAPTAGLTLGSGQGQFGPGQKQTITLSDSNQILNSGIIESLDDYRSSAVVPTLKIGSPVTLTGASDVNFYPNPNSLSNPISVSSSVPDANSARLMVDTRSTPSTNFHEITLNLGITTATLKDLFIDVSQPNSGGTNWVNYDLRSFQQQLGINSFSGTSMTLHFGSASSSSSVQILVPGTISSGNGLVQISDSTVASIESQSSSSPVYLEINFGSSGGSISDETDVQPIIFDLFSFGMQNGQTVNNAIYRAELQETAAGSGIFTGTISYVEVNQLNQFDPNLIKTLQTFGSNIVFLVNGQMVDQNGINFSISGSSAGQQTTVTSKNNLPTHTGVVTLDSANYRIGSPVTITLYDPDLVSDDSTIQSFTTVSDPNSPAVDTVGDASGNILLEVWIKGFRFHQCTINGVFHGGLAATGFTLTETTPGSGAFQGIFKMPSWICNEYGTALISPVGGIVQAWYHDNMDALGRSVIIGSTVASSSQTNSSPTQTSQPSPQTYQSSVPQEGYLPNVSQAAQINDINGLPLLQSPKVGQTITFKDIISNGDYQNGQKISYIVQVKDSQGEVVYLKWVNDTINPSNEVNEQIQWTPTTPGNYSAEVYVWDGMDSLVPLTEKTGYQFQVLPQ
ncbi:MAG: peptidase [Nitrosotalea sp.]